MIPKQKPLESARSPEEWLAIFPDAERDYLLPKLRAIEAKIASCEKGITTELKRLQTMPDSWFSREFLKAFEIQDLLSLKQEQYHLQRYFPCPPSTRGGVGRDQIHRAKESSIVDLAQTHLQEVKRAGRLYRTLCPFHQEKTPSFYLYPDTNTFHCYGCQAHGDTIALTQKLLNIGFIEAVKHLA